MIGTREIQLKRIRNGNLKLTNITQDQSERKKTSIWLQILKIVGIGVLAAGLAALGQEWATAGLIALGASETVVTAGAALTSAAIEFGVMEISDAIEGDVSVLGTFSNALPFVGAATAIKRGMKLTRILELASSTGLLKELKYTDEEIKSLSQLARMLSKQNVVVDNVVYKFGRPSDAKSTLLKLIADRTGSKAISNGSHVLKKGLDFADFDDFDDLLELQKLLRQVNPNLYPHIQTKYYSQAKQLLKDQELKPKDLLNNDLFGKLMLSATTKSGNRSASIIWALYGLRMTAEINSQLLNRLSYALKTTANFLQKIDPLYWLKKETKRIISKIRKSSSKWLSAQIKKYRALQMIKKGRDFIVEEINKLNRVNLKKIILNTDNDLDRVLFPIDSAWLLAYKFKKIISEYIVTIYFKDPRYQPRIFHWNQLQFDRWLQAVAEGRAGEYYKANLELGYHLKISVFGAVLKFLPPIILQFIKESQKVYQQIQRLKTAFDNRKNLVAYQKVGEDYLSYLKQEAINWSASILFTSVIFKNVYRNWLNDKSNLNYFKSFLVNESRKDLIKKIPKVGVIS
ncbi:hypothetical protein LD119_00709 [Mesoplasma sp. JKS002660]|uniref:hypothetical protein n=1 Tax=Mesoplasma whartonense TaxID=2878854 RepID=UPI002022AF86|nr:hypothetical protein [Mesoplasma sp. JKS002660]MCL8213758.1 hypothetical protein [Mesoplasma sp. JKS002660]